MPISSIDELKIVLREGDIPFFSDDELQFYLRKNGGDYEATAYECLCVKAEDSTIKITGLSTPDMSKYFRRLALRYRPNHSGVLTK